MAERIVVLTRTNGKIEFKHAGRPGVSYTISLSFQGSFAIVSDEYGERTIFPSSEIIAIVETPNRSF